MKEYKAIRQWHNASQPYYIDNLIKQANETNAPDNAIYRKDDGTWATVDDIKDIENRPDMAQFLDMRSK